MRATIIVRASGQGRTSRFMSRTSVIDQILAHLRTRVGPRSPEPDPNAPPPRGELWHRRPSHRHDRLVPTGIAPTVTAARTTLTAPTRERGHGVTRHAALARSPIAAYVPLLSFSPRLKFLARSRSGRHRAASQERLRDRLDGASDPVSRTRGNPRQMPGKASPSALCLRSIVTVSRHLGRADLE